MRFELFPHRCVLSFIAHGEEEEEVPLEDLSKVPKDLSERFERGIFQDG